MRNACEIIERAQAADVDGTFRRNEMYTVGGVIWFKDAIKQYGFIGHDVLSGCWDELRRERDGGSRKGGVVIAVCRLSFPSLAWQI